MKQPQALLYLLVWAWIDSADLLKEPERAAISSPASVSRFETITWLDSENSTGIRADFESQTRRSRQYPCTNRASERPAVL